MRQKQFRALLPILVRVLSYALLVFFFWTRWKLSLIRYFDADELAYLHWAHNVFLGVLPYRDFLLYVPPGFLYVLSPIFAFFHGAHVLIASRVIAFCIFVAISTVISLIFWRVRQSGAALWVAIFLVFLPVPADKLLEIRPDNLAVLFSLIGLLYHMEALRGSKQGSSWTWAGFWYGLSLMILPKTLPQIAVAFLVTLLWAFWTEVSRNERFRSVRRFVLGAAVPIVVFLLWILWLFGDTHGIETIIYSLTKLPFEVNRIGEIYPISPWQFFYPNATYYGAPGWNAGLMINHGIWMVGLLVGSVRLVTPFIAGGKKGAWGELLIAGSMMAHVVTFLYGYPMRHAQYLIPIAVFVAFYAADGLLVLRNALIRHKAGRFVIAAGVVVAFFGLIDISSRVNSPKMRLTNHEDVSVLENALVTIPKNAYVLDLVGSTIYFRDSYAVCCVPFGQWEPYLSRALPSLADRLEVTQTQYVYQGRLGRLTTLREADQAYIRAHFSPHAGDSSLLVRHQ